MSRQRTKTTRVSSWKSCIGQAHKRTAKGAKGQDHKLIRKYEGPLPTISKVGKIAYKIDLPPWMKTHLVIHVCNLKPYHPILEDPACKNKECLSGILKKRRRNSLWVDDDRAIHLQVLVLKFHDFGSVTACVGVEKWKKKSCKDRDSFPRSTGSG
ncbi:Ty3/gypsy retrotransposon protein [Quillaja saponaria]|uniref:Ty3/gypsy retrotransposon protein n=1 Tax=Quillaja saponaria TaxID=32244 RepID=A0AAD7QCS9_QUISA|nr:Ty3/gypsy retrotransposon protein [Quillaja saponaria]